MVEARYYKKMPNGNVRCELCPHYCFITEGDWGKCRARHNIQGTLYAENYAKAVSICIDPIEKKPLYHFYPGGDIISLGGNGCNLACDFCQNYSISQQETKTVNIPPEKLLELCFQRAVQMVAYTYSEPVIWFEYVLDSSKLLKKHNIKTVLITNGFINPEPLNELLPFIDAMNIDLKAMSDSFYKEIAAGRLEPVLDTIRSVAEVCHLEITNLLIPGENDDLDSIRQLVDFIASINPNIPLHFSRYHPSYKRTTPPTPFSTMTAAFEEAKKKLNYVYLGNVITDKESNTYCPNCDSLLIERNYYQIKIIDLTNNICSNCGTIIYGQFYS